VISLFSKLFFCLKELNHKDTFRNHKEPSGNPLGTITETITIKETIRNQKVGAPRKFQSPNTGKEEVSTYRACALTS